MIFKLCRNCRVLNEQTLKHILTSDLNSPLSIYQNSNMNPRLNGQNCTESIVSYSQRRRAPETKTKYRNITGKPRSHVRILIYRTWAIAWLQRLPLTRALQGFFFCLLKPEFSWTPINCFHGFLTLPDREDSLFAEWRAKTYKNNFEWWFRVASVYWESLCGCNLQWVNKPKIWVSSDKHSTNSYSS